jgi:hypothetical protein
VREREREREREMGLEVMDNATMKKKSLVCKYKI